MAKHGENTGNSCLILFGKGGTHIVKRNILISFIVHIIIICFYDLFIFLLDRFYSGIAYNSNGILLIFSAFLFISYIAAGWLFLKPTGSKKNDFKSIFLLFLSILIYYVIIFAINTASSNPDSMMSLFYGANPFLLIFITFINTTGGLSDVVGFVLLVIFLCLSVVAPSLGLFIGYKLQRKNRAMDK
jgi:hypothetical protein